jgi:U3 small nucleolar RNA-associated protein 22
MLDQGSESKIISLGRTVYSILTRGLGDRIELLDIFFGDLKGWSLKSTPATARSITDLVIGCVFDPMNVDRSVDHGPPAEKKMEAAAFRKFWGTKAELRRFKDGSILETLIWSEGDTGQPIVQQIIAYLLGLHLNCDSPAKKPTFFRHKFDTLLSPEAQSSSLEMQPFQQLMAAFSELEKSIRELGDLPLQIKQVSASDSQLRYASVSAPVYNANHPLCEPAIIIIELEGSSRWPDNLVAIQRTKIAFLIKLAELLNQSASDLKAVVGIENTGCHVANNAYIDVTYRNGAAFRIRIHVNREQVLFEQKLKEKSLDPRSRDEFLMALQMYKQDALHRPLHTQVLRILCTRFPLLSPTIRLVKKWFAAHLLSLHFQPELIELFTLRTFLLPYPWRPPSSLQTGLLRTLHFLSRWDWRVDPWIVDLGGRMTKQEVDAIATRMEAWRKIDPGMNRTVLLVASNLDPEGLAWTAAGPEKVIVARMTLLARAAVALVHERGEELDAEALFSSSMLDYDFLIHLPPWVTSKERQSRVAKLPEFKNLLVQARELSGVGCSPIQLFLEELKVDALIDERMPSWRRLMRALDFVF